MNKPHPLDFYKYRALNLKDIPITPIMVRKRLNLLKKWSESFEGFYPDKLETREGYWHSKLPILDTIVDRKPAFEIKKECIQYMVNAVSYMIAGKRTNNSNSISRILCLVSVPRMFNSEVTVFVNKEYYESFFIRNSKEHNFTLITDKNRSILKEFNITVPNTMKLAEKGYIETIEDEDEKYQGELWAIGQLNTWQN